MGSLEGLSGPKSTWHWDGGFFYKLISTFIIFLVVETSLPDTSGVSTDCKVPKSVLYYNKNNSQFSAQLGPVWPGAFPHLHLFNRTFYHLRAVLEHLF